MSKLRELVGKATKGNKRIVLDHVLTKDGGGEGEPSQELFAGNTSIARFTIYSKMADGELTEYLLRNAEAIATLIDEAERHCEKMKFAEGVAKDHPYRGSGNDLADALAAIEK